MSGIAGANFIAGRAIKRIRLLGMGVSREEIDKLDIWEAESLLEYDYMLKKMERIRWENLYKVISNLGGKV